MYVVHILRVGPYVPSQSPSCSGTGRCQGYFWSIVVLTLTFCRIYSAILLHPVSICVINCIQANENQKCSDINCTMKKKHCNTLGLFVRMVFNFPSSKVLLWRIAVIIIQWINLFGCKGHNSMFFLSPNCALRDAAMRCPFCALALMERNSSEAGLRVVAAM